jgi:transcriptional regulator with XRE-family HTH domain
MKSKKKSNKAADLSEEQEKAIKKLAERIRELRIKKGYSSFERFAFENDIDRSQYGKYERGADLRITTLVRVIKALDVKIDEFFKDWDKA